MNVLRVALAAAAAVFAFTFSLQAAPFTAGNVVVYRVDGNGAALNSSATRVFLDEYTPAGTLVQSIALPTTAALPQRACTASGTASTEGAMSTSPDGQFIALGCYDATVGTASITGSNTIPRVIGRVDPNGNIDTSTSFVEATSAGNPRTATTSDGNRFWVAGSSVGVRTTTLGASAVTNVSTTNANLRQLHIFGGQLYAGSGASTIFRLGQVGIGLPTASGTVTTNLSGVPVTNAYNSFYFADLDGTPGVDTVYIADETANAIDKFCLVGGTWVAKGTAPLTAAHGLAGTTSGSTVTLFATSGPSTATINALSKVVDGSGYNSNFAPTTTALASAAINTGFRGVAMAPATPVISASVTSPANGGVLHTHSISLAGTTNDGAGKTVEAQVTGPNSFAATCSATTNGSGAWACSVSATSDGVFSASARVPVASGGNGTFGAANSFTVDTAPTITQPANNTITTNPNVTFAGAKTGDGSTIRVCGSSTPCTQGQAVCSATVTPSATSWSCSTVLPFSSNTYYAFEIDATGNFSAPSNGVALTVAQSTPPLVASASASPSSVITGNSTLLTVTVTPGTNPTSQNITVIADLSSIGGSSMQAFNNDGNNSFSFTATVPVGTTGGGKTLPVTVTDDAVPPRSSGGAIALTVLVPTNPSGTGVSPGDVARGNNVTLTVNVTPGTNPTSTNITVTGDLTSIGGSASQAFAGSGNTFTFTAAVPLNTPLGGKTIPISIHDDQGRNGSTSIALNIVNPTVAPGTVVISQVYGGGGNSGSNVRSDFVELFNRSNAEVFIDGWSVQVFSTQSSSWQTTQLSGSILPNHYYLVKEADGASCSNLPCGTIDVSNPNATGTIAMSATSGRVALSSNSTAFTATCPSGAGLIDLVGYGNNACAEGTSAGTITNSVGFARKLGGCKDTNNNSLDLYATSPSPRNALSPANADCSTLTETFPPHVVMSQVYSGGGNSGATYHNDYVELYNPTGSPVDITDWSIQYSSSQGSGWSSNLQPLGGTIGPHEYFLIQLGAGTGGGAALTSPRIMGSINMAATVGGKVALTNSLQPLVGNCPTSDPTLVDFLGYGQVVVGTTQPADCYEGGLAASAPTNNATANFRKNNGDTDTNQNSADWQLGAPTPRGDGALVDVRPLVSSRDPNTGATDAPRDASITVGFTEPVTVNPGWYTIDCSITGSHTSNSEVASAFGGDTYIITPNVSFQPGETCSVAILKDFVFDKDGTPQAMALDASWSFTVQAAVPIPDDHLAMGNPSNASLADEDNLLLSKPEYALSYNCADGRSNWSSWHLSSEWTVPSIPRIDTFRPDPMVPRDCYRANQFDFSGSGFDRGHITPNADRNGNTPAMQETFVMSNMMAQAPANNQGPWEDFESYLRSFIQTTTTPVTPLNTEIYVVAGPQGQGGTGSVNAGITMTLANGHVKVPANTWKVALFLPKAAGNDVARVDGTTRTLAVIMPNLQSINSDWTTYKTTVHAVEQLTGYNFFSNVPQIIQNSIEYGLDGVNPPGVANESFTTAEETPTNLVLNAVNGSVAGAFTYTVGSPAHGTLSGTAPTMTYTPAPDFNGTDSFTFKVNDGTRDSITATVAIAVSEVNDAPTAADDSKTTAEDTPLSFGTGDLTANDSPGPANESAQTLNVTSVGTASHGTATLTGALITYTPNADYNGGDSFSYTVCDNGKTAGANDSKCATATVNITVTAVNDPAVVTGVPSTATTPELAPYSFNAHATDVDGDTVTFSLIGAPAGASINPSSGAFAWTPTEAQGPATYNFAVRANDGTANVDTNIAITVTEVNVAPVLAAIGSKTAFLGGTLTFTASATDADIPAQTLSYSITATAPAGAAINAATGAFSFTPAPEQAGNTYTFDVVATDGVANVSTPVSVAVIDNTAPAVSALSLSINELWPASHQMVPVTVSYTATDFGDASPVCTLRVVSNEAIDGLGDGDTAPDWTIVDAHHIQLRAERAAQGDGRIYSITADCVDKFGNVGHSATAVVTVPKSKK
jgi:DNA/RNA endonuclease G (NUC1)